MSDYTSTTTEVKPLKIESQTLVRQTVVSFDKPLNNGKAVETVINDPYDLLEHDDRVSIYKKILREVMAASEYDKIVYEALVNEFRAVAEEMKNELPF